MILAEAILGLEIFDTVWWIIAAIICVILLILIGVAFSDSFPRDSDEVIAASFIAVVASVFWPIALGIVVAIGFFAVPIYIGKYLGNWSVRQEKKRKEKQKFMNQIDKMKKIKE